MAPAKKDVETKAEAKSDEQKKNALFSQAMRDLRENHRAEFDARVTALYAEAGYEYRPRLSEEEKARKKILDLAAAAGLSVTIGEQEEFDEVPDEALGTV